MAALRYVDVVPSTDGSAAIDVASIAMADLGFESASDRGLHSLFRLYAAAPVSEVSIYELFRGTVLRLFRPDSVVRRTLEREYRIAVDAKHPDSQWFSFELDRSVLRSLSLEQLRASASAWSTLAAARNKTSVVFIQTKGSWAETETMIERLRAEIEATQAVIEVRKPRPTPIAAQRAKVHELLNQLMAQGWPNSAEVGAQLGSVSGKNPAQYASQLRMQNRLFGTWSAADRTYRHPTFQFDATGLVLPRLPELLEALVDDDDNRGWRRTLWLYGGSDQLEGRSPAAAFADDPDRVIALARAERTRQESPDATW